MSTNGTNGKGAYGPNGHGANGISFTNSYCHFRFLVEGAARKKTHRIGESIQLAADLFLLERNLERND